MDRARSAERHPIQNNQNPRPRLTAGQAARPPHNETPPKRGVPIHLRLDWPLRDFVWYEGRRWFLRHQYSGGFGFDGMSIDDARKAAKVMSQDLSVFVPFDYEHCRNKRKYGNRAGVIRTTTNAWEMSPATPPTVWRNELDPMSNQLNCRKLIITHCGDQLGPQELNSRFGLSNYMRLGQIRRRGREGQRYNGPCEVVHFRMMPFPSAEWDQYMRGGLVEADFMTMSGPIPGWSLYGLRWQGGRDWWCGNQRCKLARRTNPPINNTKYFCPACRFKRPHPTLQVAMRSYGSY